MGLFDSFKKKAGNSVDQKPNVPTVPESEKKYYQPDGYYTAKIYEGTLFEKRLLLSMRGRKHPYHRSVVCM